MQQPNGLAVVDGNLWVATFGGDEIYRLANGKKTDVIKVPNRELDGLVHLDDGFFIVTSWYASAVFRGKSNGRLEPILQAINTPADLGYDTKRHRLLVPSSMDNHVTIHEVK